MKKLFFITLTALAVFCFISCKPGLIDETGDENKSFVPVTSISGFPSAGFVGVPLTLSGIVEPPDATNNDIVWSIESAGTTFPVLNKNVLIAAATGRVLITASIINGSANSIPFSISFFININKATGPDPDPDPLSAINFVKNMGIGINIGNTLDATSGFENQYWHSGETGWGNPMITRELIRALKNHGYTTIRLPVTWKDFMGPAPDYTIGECQRPGGCNNPPVCPNRMDRAEQVVNWILEEGLYCIINLHHDEWIIDAAHDLNGTLDRYNKVWVQITQRFSEASKEKLIFESMNEIGFNAVNKNEAYTLLNLVNQNFVNTVRASGGNNTDRFLLIAGYWTDINDTVDARFIMPQDTANDKLIVSVHYYDPSTFTIADRIDNSWGFRATWGTASDRTHLSNQIAKLKTRFINNGVPVIFGEYGVTFGRDYNKDEQSRIDWMTAVTQICLDNGICPILWDTGGEINRNPPFVMRHTLQAVWQNIVIP